MRPVRQTETELGRGNCLAACVASLLELEIGEVPNFRLATDPWGGMQAWLGARGLFAVRCPADPERIYPTPRVHCILTGPSPRNPVAHAVIGEWAGVETRIVHDPHPDGTGLAGPAEWVIFLGQLT